MYMYTQVSSPGSHNRVYTQVSSKVQSRRRHSWQLETKELCTRKFSCPGFKYPSFTVTLHPRLRRSLKSGYFMLDPSCIDLS